MTQTDAMTLVEYTKGKVSQDPRSTFSYRPLEVGGKLKEVEIVVRIQIDN